MIAEDLLTADDAMALSRKVESGEITSVELVQRHLDRIDALDPYVNAFVTIDRERALLEAAEADAYLRDKGRRSLLHGVPIAIKDLTATAGMRTTFSSRAYENWVPDVDAASVKRVREAGMVVIGKTNTPEFGYYPFTESELNGICLNPWDFSRNAGGSSGGAACAVATGMLPIAHGSDAGGSIRIPAAFCGVVGLKPSRGRISMAPRAGERLAGWASEGPLANTVRDAAALLDIMTGPEPGDPYIIPKPSTPFLSPEQKPGRLRIAWTIQNSTESAVDLECAAAVERTASRLSDLGHHVVQDQPMWRGDEWSAIPTIWSTLLAYYDDPPLDLVGPDAGATAHAGRENSALDYVRAVLKLQTLSRRIVSFWDEFDVLLTPTSPMVATPNGWALSVDGDERVHRIQEMLSFTRPFNVTGQPAISLPAAPTTSGLPVGIQLVGPPGGETLILQLAWQLEESFGWSTQPPPWALETSSGTALPASERNKK